jgi:hypothetical protein
MGLNLILGLADDLSFRLDFAQPHSSQNTLGRPAGFGIVTFFYVGSFPVRK